MMKHWSCPPPLELWSDIEGRLGCGDQTTQQGRPKRAPTFSSRSTRTHVVGIVAATIVLAAAQKDCWALVGDMESNEIAENLNWYAEQLQADPYTARDLLATEYRGQTIQLSDNAAALGYQPAIASGLSPEYTLLSSDLLELPSCRSIGAMYRRDDGYVFAIFEHDTKQREWFRRRSDIDARCSGSQTRLVEVGPDASR